MKAFAESLVVATVLTMGAAGAQTAITVSMTNYALAPSTLSPRAGGASKVTSPPDIMLTPVETRL